MHDTRDKYFGVHPSEHVITYYCTITIENIFEFIQS
jgi:hypothetical protein